MTHPHNPAGPRRAPMDPDLVLAAQAGDTGAWELLVDEHRSGIYDYCHHVLRNAHDADDTAQETFRLAWASLGSLREPAAFRSWLYSIAHREALRVVRQPDGRGWTRRVDADLPTVIHDQAPPLEEQAHRTQLQTMVWDAIGSLEHGDRDLLTLHLRAGIVGKELASAVQKDPKLVNVHLNRARGRLGKAFTALVLARHARRACPALDLILTNAGLDEEAGIRLVLTAPAAEETPLYRKIMRHVDHCETCERERRARVSPAALYGTMPVFLMPDQLRDRLVALSRDLHPGAPGPAGNHGTAGNHGGSGNGGNGPGLKHPDQQSHGMKHPDRQGHRVRHPDQRRPPKGSADGLVDPDGLTLLGRPGPPEYGYAGNTSRDGSSATGNPQKGRSKGSTPRSGRRKAGTAAVGMLSSVLLLLGLLLLPAHLASGSAGSGDAGSTLNASSPPAGSQLPSAGPAGPSGTDGSTPAGPRPSPAATGPAGVVPPASPHPPGPGRTGTPRPTPSMSGKPPPRSSPTSNGTTSTPRSTATTSPPNPPARIALSDSELDFGTDEDWLYATLSNTGGTASEVQVEGELPLWLTVDLPVEAMAPGATASVEVSIQRTLMPVGVFEHQIRLVPTTGEGATLTIRTRPPDAPVLTSPADKSLVPAGTAALRWEPVPGAVRYLVRTSSLASERAEEPASVVETSYVKRFGFVGTWRWRVSAVDASGNIGPAADASFETVSD